MNTPSLSCAITAHSLPLPGSTKLRIGEGERQAHHCLVPAQPSHQLTLMLETDGGRIRQRRAGQLFDWVPQAGDISIVPAYTKGHCHSEAWTRRIVVQLQPELLEEVARDAFDSEALNLAVRFATRDETLHRLILLLHHEALQQEAAKSGKAETLLMDSLTTALAVQLLRHHARHHIAMQETTCDLCGGLSLRAQRQVVEYIADHLSGDVSLDALAKVVGLSRYHFIRAFKNTMGVTPHRYVVQQRVATAQKLMAAGRLPLREIAQQCGFADQSHFTRQFRRVTGTTPKAF
jgi:AraC family transcriptional regulator